MSYRSKLAMLFAVALSAAPFAASAHPAIPNSGLSGQAATPAIKAGCYYRECEDIYIRRRRCWYNCDYDRDYWRWRRCGRYGGCYHSRYYSHNRWGSYRRYWRPRWCCGSGWED